MFWHSTVVASKQLFRDGDERIEHSPKTLAVTDYFDPSGREEAYHVIDVAWTRITAKRDIIAHNF
jgi:hypothetical protein